jgi:GntR family transcriptional repressor for pyruvate dehydrogenase complex
MFTFEKAKPDKAAQTIVKRVRDAVLLGELPVGTRLPPERELIEQFGYSRAVVREALRLLEAEGLVKLQSGRNGGAVVHQPSTDRFVESVSTLLRMQNATWDEVHEVLKHLEPLAAELAAKRATPADIEAMQNTIDAMRAHADDPQISRVEGNKFHILMAEATHNRMLSMMATLTRQVVVRMEYPGVGGFVPEISKIHQKILDAIKANDPEAARRRTLRHLSACECVVRDRRSGLRIDNGTDGAERAQRLLTRAAPQKGH